ncbi:hypothetical protein [Devosia sp. FJ2-5-3]|uniref:hypothetical protein n=1 Tax=Devosia sp. FJ2-5-3 TaxID=2976680 RepID=UPI0023D86E55|nr:hypothetical protein [Devosia sp. FJ2-5-3]WEJ56714.1 hypothetical protein N0P34_10795 [Devosia sp. FJ2-5-3]
MGMMFGGTKDLEEGRFVRIKGRTCEVIGFDPVKTTWQVQNVTTKEKFPLDRRQVFELQHRSEIVADHHWQSLSPTVKELLAGDWNLFTQKQRDRAEFKATVCRYLDNVKFGPKVRRTAKTIEDAIKHAMTLDTTGQPKPEVQTVRRLWDPIWIASGKNPKALIDQDHKKGRRRSKDDPYMAVIKIVEDLIDERIVHNLDQVESIAAVQDEANDIVWQKHDQGLIGIHPLCNTDEDQYIGKHLVRRRFRMRNAHQQLSYDRSRREADRLTSGIVQGPRVEGPLARVECDHTPLDQYALTGVDGEKKIPWLTLLKDKFSGAACGYYISFDRPNWYAVHEAIRMAVLPKASWMATMNHDFKATWDVCGVPDVIPVDRESMHRGAAVAGLSASLGFVIQDLPKASGHLKGGIEKGLGDVLHRHIARQPGAKEANYTEMDPDKANPTMTLELIREAMAIFLVEDYNQRVEPGTGEIRIERYRRGMLDSLNWKNPPDPEIFAGRSQSAKLTEHGVNVDGIQYFSTGLRQMYFDAGGKVDVVIIVPEHGIDDTIRVLGLQGVAYVEGYRQGITAKRNLTHKQAVEMRKQLAKKKDPKEVRVAARDARINAQKGIKALSGPPRKVRKLRDAPRPKAGEHISEPSFQPEVGGAADFDGHDIAAEEFDYTRYGAGGPFAAPGLAELAIEASRAAMVEEVATISVPTSEHSFVPDIPAPPAPPLEEENGQAIESAEYDTPVYAREESVPFAGNDDDDGIYEV